MPKQQAAPAPAHQLGTNIAVPVQTATGTVSALMDSSLPPLAAGADLYTRQFYSAGRGLPQRRFLPVRPL